MHILQYFKEANFQNCSFRQFKNLNIKKQFLNRVNTANTSFVIFGFYNNAFWPNVVPFIYPMKTLNQRYSHVFKGYKNEMC